MSPGRGEPNGPGPSRSRLELKRSCSSSALAVFRSTWALASSCVEHCQKRSSRLHYSPTLSESGRAVEEIDGGNLAKDA